MIYKFLLFLLLNFGALAIGGLFTGEGVTSDWYAELNQAPWTPPGWVFGAAWTTIMVCFSFYMTYAFRDVKNVRLLITLFVVQWILNVLWNPTFFFAQNVVLGLVIISALTLLIGYFLIRFWPELRSKSVLLLPYFIWLMIATSLNGYIFLNN